MEAPGTITVYLGSSTTSEFELASLQIIPIVPIHQKQQLQENTTLPHATRQGIYQKARFQIKKQILRLSKMLMQNESRKVCVKTENISLSFLKISENCIRKALICVTQRVIKRQSIQTVTLPASTIKK